MKVFGFFILIMNSLMAGSLDVVPRPKEVLPKEGQMSLVAQTTVLATQDLQGEGAYLATQIGVLTGYQHRVLKPHPRLKIPGAVMLKVDQSLPAQHHKVVITPRGATITGHDAESVFHGIQSFLQLAPTERVRGFAHIPCGEITDAPAHEWREVKLDLARHVFPKADLKKFIDQLAFHKFNKLSLHLTDDQGWRLESRKYPKLTEIGGMRKSSPPYGNRHGSDDEEYTGYYTQEVIRELVAYAKSRHIEIIPVIALPGRVSAALAAYPELGNDDLEGYAPRVLTNWSSSVALLAPKEETFAWIDEILSEVCLLFPSEIIAIHDKQVSLKQWEQSPRAQSYLKAKGLKDEDALWAHFMDHIAQTLKKKGRRLRTESTGSFLRLDRYQRPEAEELKKDRKWEAVGGLLTVQEVYHSQKTTAVLWTPYMHDWKKVEYMAFPRLAALSEVLWMPQEQQSYRDFLKRFPNLRAHYQKRNMTVGEVYEVSRREALHGTVVTSSLGHYLDHWPEALFDGKKDTLFWSDRGLEKGDHLTLIFPHAIEGDIEVATGTAAVEVEAALVSGVLEVSPDGKEWNALTEFLDGLATVTAPAGTRGLRIRVTEAQEAPLTIHEIILSEPLLPMKLDETRTIHVTEEQTQDLTFRGDFSKHPEFREKVAVLRKRYFSLWPRACNFFGILGLPETPDTLTIAFGKKAGLQNGVLTFDADQFQTQSVEDIEGLFIEGLCTHLQSYAEGAPSWFSEGMTTIVRAKELPDSAWAKALPKQARKSDALTGGWGSACFLNWVTEKHTAFPLTQVSRNCRTRYEKKMWEATTGLSLEKLVEEYQK